jgi:hypothetical protein
MENDKNEEGQRTNTKHRERKKRQKIKNKIKKGPVKEKS